MKTENISLTYGSDAFPNQWAMSVAPTEFPKGPGNYPKLKAKAGEADVYKFKIKTENIKFATDKAIEISLAPGQSGPGDPGQFTWSGQGTDTLTVNNPNKDGAETNYYYKLNFDNSTSLDPIIQNGCCRVAPPGDGGGFLSFFSEPAGIAVLLLAVAVIALVALRMRRAG